MSRSMSFESPDVEKDFPGLYASERQPPDATIGEEPERPKKREGGLLSKKKEKKKDKDKGYSMFEAEDSEEEQLILVGEDIKSPSRGLKKHSKPSFKFAKKDKFIITKRDKDEKREKEGKKEEKKRDDAAKDKKRLKKKTKLGLGLPVEATTTVVDCKPIFGVPLQVAVERSRCHDGIQLPSIFRECIDYIEEHGLSCEGIYRISGVKSKIQALKESYNKGRPVYLYEHEPNIVASLLKQYLRELPEPVLTTALMPKFEEASTIKDPRRKVDQFSKLVKELPTANQLLLSWMIVHMSHIIARAKENKMSLQNVSIVLSPTMQISHRVLNVLFTYCLELFASNCIKKYVPPLKPATSKWSLELPDSPNAIEEELTKQESLLNQLHDEMSRGYHDPEKEEQLWEVQRVVTQLKRKLKFARKKTQDSGKVTRQGPGQRIPSAGDEDIVLNFDLQKPEDKDVEGIKAKDSGARIKVVEAVEVTDGASDRREITEKTKPVEAKKDSGPVVGTETITEGTEPGEKQVADDVKAVGEVGVDGDQVEGENAVEVEDDKEVDEDRAGDRAEESLQAEAGDVSRPEEIVTAAGDAQPDAGNEEGEGPAAEAVEGEARKPEISMEQDIEGEEDEDDVDEEVAAVTAEAEEEKEEASPVPVQQKRVKIIEPPKEETPEEDPRADTATPPQTLPVQKHRPGFGLQSPLKPEILHKTGPRKLKHQGRIDEETGSGHVSNDSQNEEEEAEAEENGDHGPITDEPDEEMQQIQLEYQTLLLEEEEYIAVGDELKKKITAERDEIERLQMEIEEVRCIRGDSFDADDWSDSDSSYESGDEDELQDILQQLMKENAKLEVQNKELCRSIHQERKICLDVKVQIRIIQQQAEQYAAGSDSLL